MSGQLPIEDILPRIKSELHLTNKLIVQAPPGAGKSTLLPISLLSESWLDGKKILMLEPRKLAARSVAARMASLLGEVTGETVGYRVRFENKTGKTTRLEVLTEGILTRMIQQDNMLEDVGLVIFDEFHERNLQADLALALCRECQEVLREDLKIIIMSATLDGERLSELLGGAPVITSEGRQFPVTVKYLPPEENRPLPNQVYGALLQAMKQEKGDILVFLPGTGEIRRTQALLEQNSPGIKICPLYGDLPQREQQEALMPDPSGRRKVVLATSIAETSLTIEGITVVIDSGYSRVSRFDPRSGLTKLETIRVTLDAADQRAGRAGRLGPGVAWRLWSEGATHFLQPGRKPEILEADLAPLALEVANWGAKDVNSLTWLTPPPTGAVAQARELLTELKALEGGRITQKGRDMLRLPTHPRISHLLLAGKDKGLLPLATDIASLLEERDPLPRETGADISLRVETLRKWRKNERVNAEIALLTRIEKLASNWRKILGTHRQDSMPDHHDTGKLIAEAYPERIARKLDDKGGYRLATGKTARINEYDPLSVEEWLAVSFLDSGNKEGKIFMAAPLDVSDVVHMAEDTELVEWDYRKSLLVAARATRIGEITVETKKLNDIDPEQVEKILCEVVRKEGEKLLPFTENIENWQARVMSLRLWNPEDEWPDVSTANLLETAGEWLTPYLTKIRKADDFKKLDLWAILQGLLPWPLPQTLDEKAPVSIKVPSGSSIKLEYFPDGRPPVLAVRLQEVFGLTDTPSINNGKNRVLLHLLSPGYKPVQVTQDLRSFWQNTYPEVRKELRMRYSKHSWPEDPWTAEAVRGAKRRNQ